MRCNVVVEELSIDNINTRSFYVQHSESFSIRKKDPQYPTVPKKATTTLTFYPRDPREDVQPLSAQRAVAQRGCRAFHVALGMGAGVGVTLL